MAKEKNIGKTVLIILAILAVLSFTGIGNKLFVKPQAIGTTPGAYCTTNENCPCWSEAGKGIGVGTCKSNACDMAYCFDIEPVEDWFKDKPLTWIKENLVLVFGIIIALIFLQFYWHKI